MKSPLGTLAHALSNKAPVPYAGRSARFSAGFTGTRNDQESQLRAMESVGTLFAIVDRLATAVAEVDWTLYRAAPSGLPEDRTPVTSHLALDIWRKPNPWMPRGEFVEVCQQHLDLAGESWWVIARNPRMRQVPLELWPVRPDRMSAVPDPTDFIVGYVYTSPDGERVPLKVDEVVMLRRPHPLDPYRGISPVSTVLPDLDATRLSAEWNRNFFRNSALPSGVIETEKTLNDDEFDQLQLRWEEQHRGVAAAHRVAILEGGLKWVDRKFTQRDMEFVALRGVSREIIREAYAMHGHSLGLSEDVNRANAEAADATFARWLVKPRLERFKAALNHDFLPLFGAAGEGLEWDYANPVPEDRELAAAELTARATAAKAYVEAGYTGDSVKEALELPESLVWEAPPPPPAPVSVSPPVEQPAARRVPEGERPALVLGQADVDEPREDWEQRLEDLVADWERAVTAAQRVELAEQITRIVDEADRAALSTLAVSSGAGAALLEAAMAAQAEAAAARMVASAEEQGVTISPAVVAGALAVALAAGAGVTAGLLAAGLAAAAAREALRVWAPGASGREVARRVLEFLEGLGDATLRTELGGAVWSAEQAGRFATLEQAEEDGRGATYFEASESRDKATCERCAVIDGTRFDTLPQAQAAYPNGGFWACLGRIRCRGTIEPHWGGS